MIAIAKSNPAPMFLFIVRFISIVAVGVISGILLGIVLGYNPNTFTYATYLELQQGAIKSMNVLMPVFGQLTTVIVLVFALQQRSNKITFFVLLAAALLLVVSGLVTKFGNQPINSIVMGWTKAEIPSNWEAVRDRWWIFHQIRTVTTFVSFCLVVYAGLRTV